MKHCPNCGEDTTVPPGFSTQAHEGCLAVTFGVRTDYTLVTGPAKNPVQALLAKHDDLITLLTEDDPYTLWWVVFEPNQTVGDVPRDVNASQVSEVKVWLNGEPLLSVDGQVKTDCTIMVNPIGMHSK